MGTAKGAKVDGSVSWAYNAQKTATEVGSREGDSVSVVTLITPNCFLAHLARFLAPGLEIVHRIRLVKPHRGTPPGHVACSLPKHRRTSANNARSGVLHHTTIERAVALCQ